MTENGERIDTAYLEIDGVKDSITAQAETIRLQGVKVDDNGERIDTAFVEIDGANDRIDAQADEIYLQAEKLEAQADEISLQAETLKIKADVDLLDAYVKANELEAFILYVAGSGRINDLIANTLTATSSVVAETGRFDTSLYGMAMECSMLTVNDSIGMGGQWYGGLALNLLTGTTPWIETATKTISFLTPYNDEETVKVVTGVYLHGITSVPVGLIGYEA